MASLFLLARVKWANNCAMSKINMAQAPREILDPLEGSSLGSSMGSP